MKPPGRQAMRWAGIAILTIAGLWPTAASALPPGDKTAGKHAAKAAGAQPKDKVEPKTGLTLVWLPGGKFHYGCEKQDTQCFRDEKPGREATVKSFWMGKTDVTLEAYEKCMAAGKCAAPKTGGSCNYQVAGRQQHPVNCIEWHEAEAFCGFIGMRLPTAEEWEYAAKGGESRIYPWGDQPLDATRANFCEEKCRQLHKDWTWIDRTQDDGWSSTSPVGAYPAGASKQGLLDMVGNCAQWTQTDAEPGIKEVRGGAWDLYTRYLRNSMRIKLGPSHWYDNVTIRCAQ